MVLSLHEHTLAIFPLATQLSLMGTALLSMYVVHMMQQAQTW
jgi:hypothetical protein